MEYFSLKNKTYLNFIYHNILAILELVKINIDVAEIKLITWLDWSYIVMG